MNNSITRIFPLFFTVFFIGWGGDDDVAILLLAGLGATGIGLAALIRYTRESIIPAMRVLRDPPQPPPRRRGRTGASDDEGMAFDTAGPSSVHDV